MAAGLHFPGFGSPGCIQHHCVCPLYKQLQVVADICDSNVTDSEALLKCMREKSSLELLDLSQVKRDGTAEGG